MTLAELEAQQAKSLAEAAAVSDAASLEQVRVRYLGRNGLLPAIVKQMKDVPPEERPAFGKRTNAWRAALEAALAEKTSALGTAQEKESAAFDPSLPGR